MGFAQHYMRQVNCRCGRGGHVHLFGLMVE